MRCKRIEFEGYRRLEKTGCDVNQSLVAFVGRNEAGKSSVLAALQWLSEPGQTALPPTDRCRSRKKESGWIVGATFVLDDDDKALIADLDFKEHPTELSAWKQAEDGRLHCVFASPNKPQRNPAPFEAALKSLEAATQALAADLSAAASDADDDDHPDRWIGTVADALKDPDRDWSDSETSLANRLADWLSEDQRAGLAGSAPDDLRTAAEIGYAEHPRDTGIDILRSQIPKFVLFEQHFRELPTDVLIHDQTVRDGMAPAIKHLLEIAELDLSSLWEAKAGSDSGEVETLPTAANERLDAFFGQAWNQSNVSVRFKTEGNFLQTHIYEIDNKRFTRIEERSDGLRAFIALAAFLEAQRFDVPPILLIDEAETHLHFDAQADLVGVLLKQVQATQVFYTTHSPGCLPSDLGTGIRLVQREAAVSKLKSHFWTNEAPGFGPLLFAMGAGAAAFSACRWAVLAEGPSEMVLLPTLIRLATRLDDLPYQVAPGLANAHAYGMKVEEVAAKVVYLTDGDGPGKRYRESLTEANVATDRIFTLPGDQALEDLLDRDFYLDIVAQVAPKGTPLPNASALPSDVPIATALASWAAAQTPPFEPPGKIAVAYKVVESEIVLADGAQQVLADLHESFIAALDR